MPALDPGMELRNTFGVILLSTFIGLILYGMVVHQSYLYFKRSSESNDPFWLKSLVSAVLLLETFHMTLSTHACYYYLVTSFAEPSSLLYGVWSLDLLTAVSGTIVICAQSFFARRVYYLLSGSRYRILVYIVIFLLVGELALFCAATVEAFLHSLLSEFSEYVWLISAGAAMAGVADTILSSVLVVFLRKNRNKGIHSVLDTLILYSVSTGLLTSIVNLATFISSLVLPKNLVYGAFGIVCTKLYANSFLASLNARQTLELLAKADIEANKVGALIGPKEPFVAT